MSYMIQCLEKLKSWNNGVPIEIRQEDDFHFQNDRLILKIPSIDIENWTLYPAAKESRVS